MIRERSKYDNEAVFAFLLGSAITAVAALSWSCYQNSSRRSRKKELGGDEANHRNDTRSDLHPFTSNPRLSTSPPLCRLPAELREEQLSRNTLYFGEDGMTRVRHAHVAVVGVGGVGSHAALMLARAGVGYLRVIDFDQVTLSSLNRHACATLADVGISKVKCVQRYVGQICGAQDCVVDAQCVMFTESDEDRLLGLGADGRKLDFVVDAIDDAITKVQLLAYCIRNGIHVVSCMGAGGKCDVTRIHIGDLPGACHDPLATKIRSFLKRRNVNVDSDLLDVVYSSEKTTTPLAELTEEQQQADGPGNFGAVDNMRVRLMPVLGTMPAMMGQACAAFLLCELAGKSFAPLCGERMGRNVRHRIFQHLKNREKSVRVLAEEKFVLSEMDSNCDVDGKGYMVGNTWVGPIQVDCDDVEYLVAEVWRNRCAVTGERMSVVLELTRWDMSRPSTCNNLVLMSTKAMKKFDSLGRKGMDGRVRRKIELRLSQCKIDSC